MRNLLFNISISFILAVFLLITSNEIYGQNHLQTTTPRHFIKAELGWIWSGGAGGFSDLQRSNFITQPTILLNTGDDLLLGFEYAYALKPDLRLGIGLRTLGYNPHFSFYIPGGVVENLANGYFKLYQPHVFSYQIPLSLYYQKKIWAGLYFHAQGALTMEGLWNTPDDFVQAVTGDDQSRLEVLELNYESSLEMGWGIHLGLHWQFDNFSSLGIGIQRSGTFGDLLRRNHSILIGPNANEKGVFKLQGFHSTVQLYGTIPLQKK